MIIAFWIILSLIFGFLSIDKTIGFWGGFFISLLFSPIVGFIAFLVSSEKKENDDTFIRQVIKESSAASAKVDAYIGQNQTKSIQERLIEIKKLLDDGLITQEEHELMRSKIISNP